MDHDETIVISCLNCRSSFFIEALTTNYRGDVPTPTYCPYCASHELEEGFILDDLLGEDAELFREEMAEQYRSECRPKLTLLPGGKADGGQDGKSNEEDRNSNYGGTEQSKRVRQDDRPRHPYER
jgi:hypothetical protein